jgi:8-oxo-dGTP pyrophosphatase MutT (NUDIX family)
VSSIILIPDNYHHNSGIELIVMTLNNINHRLSPYLQSPFSGMFSLQGNRNSTSALARTAAVLIIVHSENKVPHILLTRRSSQLKHHTGEISFPGGQFSRAEDQSLLDTALRETREEVGLSFKAEDILGRLKTVYTLTSNFAIVPFITIQEKISEPRILASEVDCIVDVPLHQTLSSFEPDIEHYHISRKGVYKFTYEGFIIWGATARILKQLYDRLHV